MAVSREFIEELKRNGVKAEVCPPRVSFSFYSALMDSKTPVSKLKKRKEA
jgi:uncharacterized LabA/DUF88 family protein